jgi:hypothetical protein
MYINCKRVTRTRTVNGELLEFKGYNVFNGNEIVCFIDKCETLQDWSAWNVNMEGEALAGGQTKKELLETIERLLKEGTLYMSTDEITEFRAEKTEPATEPITKEEIKALLIDRKMEISDVIDVVVEINGIIGVGLITLGEGLKDYTQGLIRK